MYFTVDIHRKAYTSLCSSFNVNIRFSIDVGNDEFYEAIPFTYFYSMLNYKQSATINSKHLMLWTKLCATKSRNNILYVIHGTKSGLIYIYCTVWENNTRHNMNLLENSILSHRQESIWKCQLSFINVKLITDQWRF